MSNKTIRLILVSYIAIAVISIPIAGLFVIPDRLSGKYISGEHGSLLQIYCNDQRYNPALFYAPGDRPTAIEVWQAKRWAQKYSIDCISEGWAP